MPKSDREKLELGYENAMVASMLLAGILGFLLRGRPSFQQELLDVIDKFYPASIDPDTMNLKATARAAVASIASTIAP